MSGTVLGTRGVLWTSDANKGKQKWGEETDKMKSQTITVLCRTIRQERGQERRVTFKWSGKAKTCSAMTGQRWGGQECDSLNIWAKIQVGKVTSEKACSKGSREHRIVSTQ